MESSFRGQLSCLIRFTLQFNMYNAVFWDVFLYCLYAFLYIPVSHASSIQRKISGFLLLIILIIHFKTKPKLTKMLNVIFYFVYLLFAKLYFQWFHIFRDWILLVCFSWRYEATEGPRVNFVMREALFEITRGSSVASYLHEKQTSRIQSLYYIFILYQNCTVLATKYPFFNSKHPVIILRASLFVVTPSHVASWKIKCQHFSYVYRSRKH